jgi:hypothetical protein
MTRMIAGRLLTIVVSTYLVVWAETDGAAACSGPHTRVFPTCEIDAPRADERTTVIYANGGKALSSATLGSDSVVTEVVDVEIEPAEKPHYIALSSGKPVIWRFTGRVDTVSRVVVLGSQYDGTARAGVVGVPKERVTFAKTDLEALKKVQHHSCLSLYRACELSAYFDIPKADRMELAGPAPQHHHPVGQFVEHLRAGLVRIPRDGTVEAEARGRFGPLGGGWVGMTGPALGRYEPYGGTGYIETSQSHERGVITIDASTVLSPEEVRPYKILPGHAGLLDLIKSGTVVAPDAPEFKIAYDAWNEAISTPFRSDFDPSFLFSYKVDYLITRSVQLPAALHKLSFLVADKVDAPDLAGGSACVFFADQRELVIDRKKQADPRCDKGASFWMPKRDSALALMRWSLDEVKGLSEAKKEPCRQSLVEDDTYFAGVAISEGPAWRPGAVDASRRRVDVLVKRPGKVALYLEMWGGRTDWHIAPSPATQISSVLLAALTTWAQGDKVHGLDSSVPVSSAYAPAGKTPCYLFNPSRYAYLGGPAALALNERLKVRAGRGLDRLLRSTNDGTWPPISSDPAAPRVTLEIE